MKILVEMDLTHAELNELAALAGRQFMTGEDMKREMRDIVKRELTAGIDMGYGYRLSYYREDPSQPGGYKLYTHVFQGQLWPHVKGRPRFYYDGKNIRTRGGAFIVNNRTGIIDQRPPARGTNVRAS